MGAIYRSLEELPFYTLKLLKEVKLQLAKGPKNREVKHIDIARPYASEMKLLKPDLTKEFNKFHSESHSYSQ